MLEEFIKYWIGDIYKTQWVSVFLFLNSEKTCTLMFVDNDVLCSTLHYGNTAIEIILIHYVFILFFDFFITHEKGIQYYLRKEQYAENSRCERSYVSWTQYPLLHHHLSLWTFCSFYFTKKLIFAPCIIF